MKTSVVIDGDKDFLSFVERHLILWGYKVFSFTDVEQFLSSLKSNPQLVILGDNLGGQQNNLDYVRMTRKTLPKSTIIHIAKANGENQGVSAMIAGASEFIEKDNATFVRMRTCLDTIEEKNTKGVGSFLSDIKKAFIG